MPRARQPSRPLHFPAASAEKLFVERERESFIRGALAAAAVALFGCGSEAQTPACIPSCADATSCRDSCGGTICPCPQGDVCDTRGACRPCVVGACKRDGFCVDECGNPDNACATTCGHPDSCEDNCGVVDTARCAGQECDPSRPGACLDTCGLYADRCCCVPTTCADAQNCVDDCGNFDPSQCRGRVCSGSCADSCDEPDDACGSICADPLGCNDDCGRANPALCSGHVCDPNRSGFDSCGNIFDGC